MKCINVSVIYLIEIIASSKDLWSKHKRLMYIKYNYVHACVNIIKAKLKSKHIKAILFAKAVLDNYNLGLKQINEYHMIDVSKY